MNCFSTNFDHCHNYWQTHDNISSTQSLMREKAELYINFRYSRAKFNFLLPGKWYSKIVYLTKKKAKNESILLCICIPTRTRLGKERKTRIEEDGGWGKNEGIEKLISFPPSLKTFALLFRLGLNLFHSFSFFCPFICCYCISLELLTFNGSMFCGHITALLRQQIQQQKVV